MMNESKQFAAKLLGYAGLAPFVATAIYVAWFALTAQFFAAHVAFVGLAYGATILSFVGALHWAHAMHHQRLGVGSLIRSVVPSLVAWLALCIALLVPGGFGVHAFAGALLMGCLLDHLRADRALHRQYGEAIVPAWFYRLRVHLTLAACACLLVISLSAIFVK